MLELQRNVVAFAFCCNALNAMGRPSYLGVIGTSAEVAYAFDGEARHGCVDAIHLIKGTSLT